MGVHMFPILKTPLTSLPTPFLRVIPVHWPWAPVSCTKPGLEIYFTYGNIHISVQFSQIIPPLLYPTETLTMWIRTNCGKFLKMGIPDHLTCLLRNLYAGQEATVRIRHGITDWFKIWKGVHQGCILSPCLFNLHAQYIMWNAGLDEAQAGIKIAGRNINNLRYADDTTLMAESEEELKSLLMNVKEES